MRSKMTRVYVAGPYTLGDVLMNVRNAIKAGSELVDKGFAPYVPHLNWFWEFLDPRDDSAWLAIDREWLRVSDMVLRLPGESKGSDKEIELANELMIPVFYSIYDLVDATTRYSYLNH